MNGSVRRLVPRSIARWYRRRRAMRRYLQALSRDVDDRHPLDRMEDDREASFARLVKEVNERNDRLLAELDRRIEALRAEVEALRGGDDPAPGSGSHVNPRVSSGSAGQVLDVERLVSECLPPSGSAVQLDLMYRLLLRRPIEEEKLRSGQLALAAGEATRADLARWIVESPEFAEIELIEKTLSDLMKDPFTVDDGSPIGPGTTERVVEIPWALSRWRGEERVLDVGYAYAAGYYLTALLALSIPSLHGVDWSAAAVPGMVRARGDLRALPYRDGAFDLVICISTIEHVGMDNMRYGLAGHRSVGGDVAALREMERIVRPGGRVLITVPFGRREEHDWFVQYDSGQWEDLVGSTSLREEEREVFELADGGWVRATAINKLERLSYGQGAPAARAVLCASLVRYG